jgi:hypothetical protein
MATPNYDYKHWGTLRLAGVTTATQGPNVPCKVAIFKAHPSNDGLVYVGEAGVATTTGHPLAPGEELLLFVGNLNQTYRICSSAGQASQVTWQG